MKEKISNAILTTCVVSNKDTGIPRAVDIIHKMFIEEQVWMLEDIKLRGITVEEYRSSTDEPFEAVEVESIEHYISQLKDQLK